MAQAYVMFVDNDMLVEVDGLQDSSDDSYLNAATVTANLFDENGTLVTGQTMPISMSYVASSNGKYQGIFDSVRFGAQPRQRRLRHHRDHSGRGHIGCFLDAELPGKKAGLIVPAKVKTPCGKRGCGALTRERYCREHHREAQVQRRKAFDERKDKPAGYSPELYSTAVWRKLRKWWLEYHPLCTRCESRGLFVGATDVDHIEPHMGSMEKFLDTENLQSLCHRCHSSKTQREVNNRCH
jgi:5-methylcytosine-specific restriction protein A